MYAVRKARNGGVSASVKRVLSAIPVNPQNFSESPYFDTNLFSYDEKVVNALTRTRPCLEYAAKFYDRRTGRLAFKMEPGGGGLVARSKRSCVYIFHPLDPVCFSVQVSNAAAPVLNIHYRA